MIAVDLIDALIEMVRVFPRILTLDTFKILFPETPHGPEMTGLIMGFRVLQKARWASRGGPRRGMT